MSYFFRRGHAGYSSQGQGGGDGGSREVQRGGNGGSGRRVRARIPSDPMPFCIDDAFDIPEDAELPSPAAREQQKSALLVEEDETQMTTPIIRNGQLRLDFPNFEESAGSPGGGGGGGASNNGITDTGSQDSASLIQGDKTGHGYYEGPTPLKYWWLHPKIRSNYKLVLAAVLLCVLGIVLIIGGIVVYSVPGLQGVQALVFIIAGVICFLPGAYHIVYIYLAVKGKRGFEFNHLPLFNN